ncbi:TauD/TfdA dioxygenase family protein [Variovorax sp. LT1P1]|uniref:TauD/TfdA dioxygenase family protein n=1 Tax=Variovorax sp. LT1P1 TaxID=3443730 RepID=UPI003F445E81
MPTVTPVFEDFAAEIGDLDLSGDLNQEKIGFIEENFWKYSVLVFPDQKLTQQQHIAFGEALGPLETAIPIYRPGEVARVDSKISDVSNLNSSENVWTKDDRMRMFQLGNRIWHTDSSFRHVPAYASALYARSIAPVGGLTQFADMRAAYDALDPARQEGLEKKIAEHSIFHSRARLGFHDFSVEERQAMPPVRQKLIRTIPQSQRKSIYVASHAGKIEGDEESVGKALIDGLIQHATQRQFVYTHRWRLNDVVLWDNRCTMHRGTDFDDLRWCRDFQRVTISDGINTCEVQ